MQIETAYVSACGGREYNDDTVQIMEKEGGLCAFVGDGLGGYSGGRLASEAAAKAVMEEWKTGKLSGLKEDCFLEVGRWADEAVKQVQREKNGRMKTTMTMLCIENGQARWMHTGDTRIYCFENGKLKSQTMDHSVSQVAVLMGEIKQEEIRFHEDRNRVLRALGSENAKPEVSKTAMLGTEKTAFLLCTDGFWEYVYEAEMEKALQNAKTPQEWLFRMEEILKKRIPADNDNYSAAAVFVSKI